MAKQEIKQEKVTEKQPVIKRRDLRVKILQILYAYEMSGDPINKIKKDIVGSELDSENNLFFDTLISNIINNGKSLDDIISAKCDNWELERISVIDKLVLKIGMAEILYMPEIPPKVSINEAIDIAKEYCTRNSGKFVNGILDSFLNDLKNEGTLNKSGKGLVDLKKSKR
ncbi:MAG TPA: transcription antitermination factor NusB [Ignavibacteria bacterium]|nr:transcription antitermination factor NusB [Ignavibacteria bacterium]